MPPSSFCASMRALNAANPFAVADATPVSSVTTPTVIVSGVMPGALAVLPAVGLPTVVAGAAVVPGAAEVADGLVLPLLHATATKASTAMDAAAPRLGFRNNVLTAMSESLPPLAHGRATLAERSERDGPLSSTSVNDERELDEPADHEAVMVP